MDQWKGTRIPNSSFQQGRGRARYPSRRLRGAATLQGILRAVPHSGTKLGARAGSGLQENRGQPGWYGSCLKKMGKHGTTLKSGCFEHRFYMFSPFNSHLMLFEGIIRTFSDIPIRVWTHGVVSLLISIVSSIDFGTWHHQERKKYHSQTTGFE